MENPMTAAMAPSLFDNSRKRGRDEEDEIVYSTEGFAEHRQKRHQCLPSLSPNSQQKRWSDPPIWPLNAPPVHLDTITPAASDCGEFERGAYSSWESPARLTGNGLGGPQDSMDVEMDVSSPTKDHHSAFHSESQQGPGGRIPTPIQPNFAAQVRGGPWSGPGPALNHSQMNGVHNLGHEHAGFASVAAGDKSIPRTMDSDVDWTAVRDRRLPSPISEGEDSFSPMDSGNISPPGVVLESGFTNQLAARLASSISISTPGDRDNMMELEQQHHQRAQQDLAGADISTTTVEASQQPGEVTSAPATPSPGKKGHMRSRHTINTWTWQPGMKKSFSIGYRADCEKCRLKVPGHFNHIIIS